MSVQSAIARRAEYLTTVGKIALNSQYPNEFEVYIIAFELVDRHFNTLKYFIFPINPSSLEESKPELTNIKQTMTGISTLNSPTFVPTDITLSGSFGREFKVLLGGGALKNLNYSFSMGKDIPVFDERVKTGYGCCKVLEGLIDDAKQQTSFNATTNKVYDEHKKLIFHNPALGNSYIVKPMNLKFSMSEQTNMIWNYTLQLKSVARLESVRYADEIESTSRQLMGTAYAQKRVNQLVNVLGSFAGNAIERI